MLIGSIRHKGLKRLVETGEVSGVPPALAGKLRRMISSLQTASAADDLRAFPAWRVHQLTGDRKGTWSLHVSANWRLTFSVSGDPAEAVDLDFEDYH